MRVWGQAGGEGHSFLCSFRLLQLCVRACVCCLSPLAIIVENTKTKPPTNTPSFLPTPSALSGMDSAATVLTSGRGRRGSG